MLIALSLGAEDIAGQTSTVPFNSLLQACLKFSYVVAYKSH